MESTRIEPALSTQVDYSPTNKVAAYWVQKIANMKLKKTGVLDLGATSDRAELEEGKDALEDTGEQLQKTFMFPDRQTAKATKKMLLKHNLCKEAREMNIILECTHL